MSELISTTLREQEEIIERGLASFVEVGNALMRIRDDRLYHEAGFAGFVDYLDSKPWGISERSAYERIDTAKVCAITQTNQEQAKALAPLLKKSTPEVVRQVYSDVAKQTTGAPSGKALKAKVREVLATQNGGKTQTKRSKVDTELEQHLNGIKKLVPRWEHRFVDAHSAKEARKRVQVAEEIAEWLTTTYVPAHAALVTPLAKVPT